MEAYQEAYRQANIARYREYQREYHRAWYKAHQKPKKKRKKSGRPKVENPSANTLYARKWRAEHSEEYKAYQREYHVL